MFKIIYSSKYIRNIKYIVNIIFNKIYYELTSMKKFNKGENILINIK